MCHRVQKIHLSLRLPKELSAVVVRHFCRFWNLQSETGPAENGWTWAGPALRQSGRWQRLGSFHCCYFRFCGWQGNKQELGQFSSCCCLGKGRAAAEATAGVIPSRRPDKNWSWGRGWDTELRFEEEGDQLLEFPRPGVSIASGEWGMHRLRVNSSEDVITASSCVLGREKEGDVFSPCSVTALKMFPPALLSTVGIIEAGLKSVFMERHRCSLVLVGSLVTEKIERSWISS